MLASVIVGAIKDKMVNSGQMTRFMFLPLEPSGSVIQDLLFIEGTPGTKSCKRHIDLLRLGILLLGP
jgi:hypothetical protein